MTKREKELAKIWDYAVKLMYGGEYVRSLAALLGRQKPDKLIDVACGTGFPAIELSKRHGLVPLCVDKSEEMLTCFKKNAEEVGVELVPIQCAWSELPARVGSRFDAVLCRGNSLIYAKSWAKAVLEPAEAYDEICVSLKAFYDILKPGGSLYVDTISERELLLPNPSSEVFARTRINGSEVSGAFFFEKDFENKSRKWRSELVFWKDRKIVDSRRFSCRGYLLMPGELQRLLRETGFREVEPVRLKGERFYDAFLARK